MSEPLSKKLNAGCRSQYHSLGPTGHKMSRILLYIVQKSDIVLTKEVLQKAVEAMKVASVASPAEYI